MLKTNAVLFTKKKKSHFCRFVQQESIHMGAKQRTHIQKRTRELGTTTTIANAHQPWTRPK